MERYAIYEGFMGDLEKKVASIQKKCNKFGCDFHFAEVGEEIREVEDTLHIDPETGKNRKVNLRFVICEAEGTARVNGWEFVASVEHTEKGNIFSKALTDVEIPERYRNSLPYCEHCNSDRARKGTFIVRNAETGEFKQVGHNCLNDFTHGMSASFAAYMASLKEIFKEAEEKPAGLGIGIGSRYYKTEEILRYTAETIRHFGYSKTDDSTSTRSRMSEFYAYDHGETFFWDRKDLLRVFNLVERVGFNPDSVEAKKMVADAMTWLNGREAKNDYMHNLKTAVSLQYAKHHHFGLLVSLFPTYNRELELEAKRKAEAAAGASSEFVGNVGDKLTVDVESIKCVTSWESCYDGYHETTTYIWKIVGKDGNIYTWKTSKWMDEDTPPTTIKGTVKEHKVFRDVKQTELTRCRVA